MPPEPAGPLSVTAPVEEPPPCSVLGLSTKDESVAGVIVNVADSDSPLSVPVMSTFVWEFTPMVVTVNVALGLPAARLTDEGTVAAEFPLESEMLTPLGPGTPLSVKVPVELVPPCTDVGFKLSEARAAGFTVSLALCTAWFRLAVITAVV